MLDLTKYFSSIVAESHHQLAWAEPERWVIGELFQRLKVDEAHSGVLVRPTEIPYYTTVRSTGKESDTGPPYGKWIDTLTHTSDLKAWLWLELKVLHATNYNRPADAMKPFVNDTASLLGFSLEATISGWRIPHKRMVLNKVQSFLSGSVVTLRSAKHSFVSAMVLLHTCEEIGWNFSKKDFAISIKKRMHLRGQTGYESPPESFEVRVEPIGRSGCGLFATLFTASWHLSGECSEIGDGGAVLRNIIQSSPRVGKSGL